MSVETKLGRRKAGTWNGPHKPGPKRASAKAIRRAGKAVARNPSRSIDF